MKMLSVRTDVPVAAVCVCPKRPAPVAAGCAAVAAAPKRPPVAGLDCNGTVFECAPPKARTCPNRPPPVVDVAGAAAPNRPVPVVPALVL